MCQKCENFRLLKFELLILKTNYEDIFEKFVLLILVLGTHFEKLSKSKSCI